MPQTEKTIKILLLSESEQSAQLDRRALRGAGFNNIHVMTSGIDAARILAGLEKDADFQPDIVVCASKLDDMDGERFCAIIRQHPRLLAFPVLLIMPNETEAEQLKALGCGASSLLGRPYSVEELKNRIQDLAAVEWDKLRNAAQQADTSAFDAALASYGLLLRPAREPEDYFRVGMRCLQENRWNYAISAFEHALRNAQIKAEAELGMAAAYKGKGDRARFKGWLARAAETLVRAKRWHLARTAYARLLQHDPHAKNPFIMEAHRQIKQKAYDEAADILVQGLSLIPKSQTGDRFARVCFTAEDPDAMLQALETGLSRERNSNTDLLSANIRETLDALAKEKQERQRQMAAERKWKLARAMEDQKKNISLAEQSPAPEPEISGFPEAAGQLEDESGDYFSEDDGDLTAGEETPVLAPLTKSDATSEIFSKKPKLNEFMSVVKYTWKLARRFNKK